MARLARYAHITPDQFGSMTPARTRRLNTHITALLDDEWGGYLELAKMIALATVRR
jgi:hypothetical protein